MRTETHSCGARWALGGAHCAGHGCHRTFAGLGAFDMHRAAVGDERVCRDPETIIGKQGQRLLETKLDRSGLMVWAEIQTRESTWFAEQKKARKASKALRASQSRADTPASTDT